MQIVGETTDADEDGYTRNPSIYDDQEFYNSLLNQYASLSMNHNATVIKQRHSKKKEIQRKASKGRRMIFTVELEFHRNFVGTSEIAELLCSREVSSYRH